MQKVYEECPVLENDKYLVRLIEIEDTADLLKVYSDKKALPYFNSDNCNGNDFYNSTLEGMREAIKYWLLEYKGQGFVRWSIIDKSIHEAIGTIELFNRVAEDAFTECGLLRLDLRSDYEKQQCIFEILEVIVAPTYELFSCHKIATKAKPFATERIAALQRIGFSLAQDKLIGHDGTQYGDYWVCAR